jgi:hypothetical protein
VQPGNQVPLGEDGNREAGSQRLVNCLGGGGLELSFDALAKVARQRLS